MSDWKKEQLGLTDKRESVITRIGKPKKGYAEVEMRNGDHAQAYVGKNDLAEGDVVTYKIAKYSFTHKDDETNMFTQSSYQGLKLKGVGSCVRALRGIDVGSIIFLDIETVSLVKNLKKNTPLYDSWEYKMERSKGITDMHELKKTYKEHSTLYPEFSRVFCVSIGRIVDGELKVMSYYDDDEADLLEKVGNILDIYSSKRKAKLAGHSIKGFDIPFLMRRMIINGIPVPEILDVSGLKPWEIDLIDTYELWRGSAYNSAGLVNITTAMGLPTPKSDITGKDVNAAFHKGQRKRIVEYCERDVLAVANITLKMMGMSTLEDIDSMTFIKEDSSEEEE